MGANSGISWTDHTFNIAWGCTKVSPGCKNCYADTFSARHGHTIWGARAPRRTFGEKHWAEPRNWNKAAEKRGLRAKVFACSMCDLFENHKTIVQELTKLWPLIRETPMLDWLLLTKRDDRIAMSLPDDWGGGYPNVALGVSVENADYMYRLDALSVVPARMRFCSYEPALGPIADALMERVDLLNSIDWMIYGGESGERHRPDKLKWATDVRAMCEARGVAFFYKQASGRRPGTHDRINGERVHNFPAMLTYERQPIPMPEPSAPLFGV